MTIHVSDYPLAGQIEGSLRVGARVGAIAAADLATSVATAKANVDTRSAALHVADKNHALPVKMAIDKVDGVVLSGASSGGSLNNIYDAVPGTFNEGTFFN